MKPAGAQGRKMSWKSSAWEPPARWLAHASTVQASASFAMFWAKLQRAFGKRVALDGHLELRLPCPMVYRASQKWGPATLPTKCDGEAARRQAREARADVNRKRTCSACESVTMSLN